MSDARRVQLQEAFKLAVSITLTYWLGLSQNWPSPQNGVIAIAIISLATVGASLNKGLLRLLGTVMGVAVGLAIIAVFGQDRWGLMGAMTVFVVVVAYVIQGSRYGYAWLMTGVTAVIVWSSSYLHVEDALGVGLSRSVETGAGVLIYTAVSMAFWPRVAGRSVGPEGRELFEDVREMFRLGRRQLDAAAAPGSIGELRARIAGRTTALRDALEAAISDSPEFGIRRREWRDLPGRVQACDDALLFWQMSIGDCRDLRLRRQLPDLESNLDLLQQRFGRVLALWDSPAASDGPIDSAEVRISLPSIAEEEEPLPRADRALLVGFVLHTRELDAASRALLDSVRRVAGLDAPPPGAEPAPRTSGWDLDRLCAALFPGICFATTYLLWIYTNPPAGNALPILAVAFGMMLMTGPINLFKAVTPLLLGIVAVAPLYMFVLPKLSGGFELLSLVFVSTFLLGTLSGRLAPLRTFALMAFAMSTNITNRQSYSFFGILYPIMMIVLGTGVITVVYSLLAPVQPGQIVGRGLRRAFDGCARLLRALTSPLSAGRGDRERAMRSRILPALRRVQLAAQGLDGGADAEGSGAEVGRLVGAMQSTVQRLQGLERASDRFCSADVEPGFALGSIGAELARVFSLWSGSDGTRTSDEGRATLVRIAGELKAELDRAIGEGSFDEVTWALLGNLRGLIEAMEATQTALAEVRLDRPGDRPPLARR